jgi:FAD binding domain/Berberine and berberine like
LSASRKQQQFDRRELVRRGAGAALGLGTASLAWPLAPARAAGNHRLSALARELDGDLVVRGGPGYAQARQLWNARFDGVRPLGIAYAETVADLKRIIRWAKHYDVPLAVRSGGHSFAGYSTTTGLVADVSRLSHVQVDGADAASVAAGAKLGSVYQTLWASGRAVPFGSCLTVAVAGLTFGGGHGFSSRALGLACDNLTAVEIVTADGRLRRCDERDHADLFWALRGAGAGSFGIATRLSFTTHPVGTVTTVNLHWAWSDVRKVIQAWQSFVPSAPDALSCVLTLKPEAGEATPLVSLNGQVFGTRPEALSLLEPLTDAVEPTKVSAVQRPFITAVQYFGGGEPVHRSYTAKSNYALIPLADPALDVVVGAVEAAAGDPRLASAAILLSGHGGAINRVERDATAFFHRDALFFVRYTTFWDASAGPANEAANLGWVRGVYEAMRPYVSPGAVTNYVDPELTSWARAYYGSHLKRLVAIKRRYDRENFFRFAQSIPTRL